MVDPQNSIIDAHIHIWAADQKAYPLAPGFVDSDLWIPSYEPQDHLAIAGGLGVGRINFVQMTWYGTDHSYILDQIAAAEFNRISVIVPAAGFRVTQGTPHFWSRPADSGGQVRCAFCPSCGSRLWHQDAAGAEKTLSIKGGSLDEPPDLAASDHIWTSRKLAGVVIPDGVRRSPEEPD